MSADAEKESSDPAYLPFLEEVARYFHTTGGWPNSESLQRSLARQDSDIDVYQDLWQAGTRLAHMWAYDTSAIALTVRGLGLTESGRQDLDGLVQAIRLFVTAYLGDDQEPEVTEEQLNERLDSDSLVVKKTSTLLDDFGYLTAGSGTREDTGRYWRVGGGANKFKTVTSVIDLLRVLDEIDPPSAMPANVPFLADASISDAELPEDITVATAPVDRSEGHAFLSYVREDAGAVDRIQRVLEAAGIRVWRDTADLWPGEDWRIKIKQAITGNSLAFIACFSHNSTSRAATYQNEELLLAVDQLRLRPPDQPWLIPVRLSDCALPEYNLGAGRTLDSLQRVELYGDRWDEGIARLVAGVLRVFASLGQHIEPTSSPAAWVEPTAPALVKQALLDPSRQIELEDYVAGLANEAARACEDEVRFPAKSAELTNDNSSVMYLVAQTAQYWTAVEPLVTALIPGCAWGQVHHNGIWTRAVERVASTAPKQVSGQTTLIELRRFPILPLLYASGLAATHRRNYLGLKAVAIDARFRTNQGSIPLIGAAHVWRPFANAEIVAQVLAFESDGEAAEQVLAGLRGGQKGKRFTPVSDYLCARLRPYLRDLIPDDDDYTETFDRLEVLLGVLATDAHLEAAKSGSYLDGGWIGSFSWRDRFGNPPIEQRLFAESQDEGDAWLPLRAGMFGGSHGRVVAAFESYLSIATKTRQQRR